MYNVLKPTINSILVVVLSLLRTLLQIVVKYKLEFEVENRCFQIYIIIDKRKST